MPDIQERKFVVYLHKNPTTGQIFYVGIGNRKRPYQMKYRNPFWNNYIHKHGNPVIDIIFDNLSKSDACKIEIEYIKLFGRRDIDSDGILVNRTTGGDGVRGMPVSDITKAKLRNRLLGTKRSAEDCRKISIGQTGRKLTAEWKRNLSISKTGINNPLFGKKLSEEHKRKLKGRISPHKGYKHSDEERQIMSQRMIGKLALDKHPAAKKVIDNSTGIIYGSAASAAINIHMSYELLRRRLVGKVKNRTSLSYLV